MPRSSRLHRIYDVAMSPALRIAVERRRVTPDGYERRVRYSTVRGVTTASYPWTEMELGDFFYAPLNGRSRSHFDVRFRQVAARRDWELAITPWALDGEPALRVALTCVGITALKKKAQHHHKVEGIRFCDGKWSETRMRRYATTKKQAARMPGLDRFPLVSPPERINPPDRGPKLTEPKVDAPLAVDRAVERATEIDATADPNYDRAAVLRERLARLGA